MDGPFAQVSPLSSRSTQRATDRWNASAASPNGPPQFVPLCMCGVHALTRTVCALSPTRVAALRERASSLFVTTSKRLLFGPQVALADSKFFFLIAFVRSILTARDLSFMLKFFHPFFVSSCHTAINEVTGLVNT